MRKQICWTLLLLGFLLLSPAPALAQAVDWQLTWQDDGTILETVNLNKIDVQLEGDEWQTAADSQGNVVLTRQTSDWAAYSQRLDRLPFKMKSRNYLLLESAAIYCENYSPDPKVLYSQIAGTPDARLSVKLPGIIRDHSADSIIDSQEAVWQLSRLDHIATEELLLKAIVFDGLLLAIILVVGAVIIIGLLFLRSIRRVHKLIEQEYSLENLELEGEGESSAGAEEQKN
jgi:hypothetical protein